MTVTRGALLYEGKAKRMYETSDPGLLLMEYKDSLTAFDATKLGGFPGKGTVNNRINAAIMAALGRMGIASSFVERISETETLVRRVRILPLEVIVRYEAQGSLCKRYGIAPGAPIHPPLVEFCLKDDSLHDPALTDGIAALLGAATRDECAQLSYMALATGEKLREFYLNAGLRLLDFKLEFGRLLAGPNAAPGEIVLADEISPDTCRLIDAQTGEKLDKDLFRFDLGDVESGYKRLLERIEAQRA